MLGLNQIDALLLFTTNIVKQSIIYHIAPIIAYTKLVVFE